MVAVCQGITANLPARRLINIHAAIALFIAQRAHLHQSLFRTVTIQLYILSLIFMLGQILLSKYKVRSVDDKEVFQEIKVRTATNKHAM